MRRLAALAFVLLTGCASPRSRLDAARADAWSWCSSASFATESWLQRRVSTPYLRVTLQAASDGLATTVADVRAVKGLETEENAVADATTRASDAVAALQSGLQHDDAVAVRAALDALATASAPLRVPAPE
jgi:hypothetical protein